MKRCNRRRTKEVRSARGGACQHSMDTAKHKRGHARGIGERAPRRNQQLSAACFRRFRHVLPTPPSKPQPNPTKNPTKRPSSVPPLSALRRGGGAARCGLDSPRPQSVSTRHCPIAAMPSAAASSCAAPEGVNSGMMSDCKPQPAAWHRIASTNQHPMGSTISETSCGPCGVMHQVAWGKCVRDGNVVA